MRVNFGGDDLERDFRNIGLIFRELPESYQKRVIGPAMLAMARVIRDAARATTAFEDRTGTLRRNIRARRYRSRKGKPPAAFVEARAPHAHLVEAGHGGPRPAPAHPFLEPATEENVTKALAAARVAFNGRTVKLARDLIRKYPTSGTARRSGSGFRTASAAGERE